ncbi:MAG TPA: EAL domain-containing protein [Mycobacteriales bacterium]|nr:EAL domain-containing protein [Mycobacteriales bacterium]
MSRTTFRVLLLTAVLTATTLVLMPLARPLIDPAALPVSVPWWTLAPAYLAVTFLPIYYETRGEVRAVSLTQVALAIGLVFVSPWMLLLARVLAAAVFCLPVRRQPPAKAAFNISLCAFEVGTAVSIASLFSPLDGAGPVLWAALLVALLLSEIVSFLVLQVLFAILGVEHSRESTRSAVVGLLAATGVFAGVAVVVVAAAWTDPWTSAVGAAVGCALAIGYRQHRRLAADQQQNARLHQFLQGLGPVDLDSEDSQDVLQQVRLLLHAEHLDLALQSPEGWRHFSDDDPDVGAIRETALEVELLTRTRASLLEGNDHMSAPLMGAQDMLGVLTVSSRMGNARPFGLRDLRMLETLATELAAAVERGRLQRELALAATTDALTHLPNLNETTHRLNVMLSADEDVIVTTCAVDSFREVNDTLGHQVGDDLLSEVTRRLLLSYPEALIGRIGGGRFCVAVPATPYGGDPSMFGLGVRAQVEGGAQLGPVGTHIKLSVGCARGREHGKDAATLIRRAETAMYSARHASGGPVVWEPAYEVEGQRRLAVVMALREALASGAIGVGFQPKVDTLTRVVTGVEALARWTHPALGAISPAEFVPLAEASGLMGPLTSTVLRQALTTCKGWQRRGGRVGVAVNVSAETILDPSFVTEVAAIVTSVNIAPDLLTLELTEGVVVNDPGLAAIRLGELRALGVKISVDDFGTGYSSLTYLKGLPVDEVKIDKAFVDGITHDRADGAVVRAVVDIAHTLGLRVVAEGVEQEEQHQMLARFGVDEVQGYLHARPMAALDMAQWLRRREQETPHGLRGV